MWVSKPITPVTRVLTFSSEESLSLKVLGSYPRPPAPRHDASQVEGTSFTNGSEISYTLETARS